MATPTLDEIEAGLDVVEPYLTHDYQRSLLALVAHVRALSIHDSELAIHAGKLAERITALEAKVAALSAADDVGRAAARAESATSPRMAQKAWAPVAEELDRLRAENAELRAANGKLREENGSLHTAKIDWEEENAELRKRVEAGAWPAPLPIDTAPLGRTVFWYGIAFKEWRCFAVTAEDMDEVRAGYSHWIPMPPPPGGGK